MSETYVNVYYDPVNRRITRYKVIHDGKSQSQDSVIAGNELLIRMSMCDPGFAEFEATGQRGLLEMECQDIADIFFSSRKEVSE